MTDQSREAFEAWLHKPIKHSKSLAETLDTLQKAIAENTWLDCWQAATAAERERCALVCRREAEIQKASAKFCGIDNLDQGDFDICEAAIRQGGES